MLFGKRKKKARDEVGRLAVKIANENLRPTSQDEEERSRRQEPILTLDMPLAEAAPRDTSPEPFLPEPSVQEPGAENTLPASEARLAEQHPVISLVTDEPDEPEDGKRGWKRRKAKKIKSPKKPKVEIALGASQATADHSTNSAASENQGGAPDQPHPSVVPIADRLRPATSADDSKGSEDLEPLAGELPLPQETLSTQPSVFEREAGPASDVPEEKPELETAIKAERAAEAPVPDLDDEVAEVKRQVASIFRSKTTEATEVERGEEVDRSETQIDETPVEQTEEFIPLAPKRLPMAPPRSGEGVTRLVFPANWCGAWIAEGGETIYIHVDDNGRCRIYALERPDGDFYCSTTFSELQTEAMIADFVREPIEGMSGERMVIQTAPKLTPKDDGPEVHFYFLVPDSENPDAGNRFALPKDPVNSAFMVTGQDNMDLNPWGDDDEINWIAESGTYYKAPAKVDEFLASRLIDE